MSILFTSFIYPTSSTERFLFGNLGIKGKMLVFYTIFHINRVLEDQENRREFDGKEMDGDPGGMRVADRLRIG